MQSKVARGFQRLFDMTNNEEEEEDDEEVVRVHVEHYIHDRTLKERLYLFMIRDPTSSFWLRLVRLSIKLLSCILYVVMATTSDSYCSHQLVRLNGTSNDSSTEAVHQWRKTSDPTETCTRWDNLFWLERPLSFWVLQFCVAMIFLVESSLLVFINYSGKLWAAVDRYITLDVLVGVPFLLPIFYWPLWKLYVPTYLNCWSAKFVLQRLFYDTHRWSNSHRYETRSQLFVLLLTVTCLIFTSVSSVHHLEGIEDHSRETWTYLNSFWFISVTLSTVGYGDLSPNIWLSKLFIIAFIFVVLVVVPAQVESYLRIVQAQRQLGEATAFAVPGKHVVICTTELRSNDLRDFLNEFFAYKEKVQDFTVIILSPSEISKELRLLTQVPLWADRVLYLQGSALQDQDLARARIFEAEACFLMVNRRTKDREAADQKTVLRAWSIADYAPHVPLYVHILKPENKIYVAFARQVICEDELKYAVLANNCHCVGISSVVTILLHTSREKSGSSSVPWHKRYGSCSGNEIYHVMLGESRLFRPFAGKNFLFTSVMVHRKFGITLIGVRRDDSEDLLLNPGRNFVLRLDDTCFYVSIAREENSKFVTTDCVLPKVRPALRRSLATLASFSLGLGGSSMKSDTENDDEEVESRGEDGLESFCRLRKSGNLAEKDGVKSLRRMQEVAMGRGMARRHALRTEAELVHFEGKRREEPEPKAALGFLAHATMGALGLGFGFGSGFGSGFGGGSDGETETNVPKSGQKEESSSPNRDFNGMDSLKVKQEAREKKRDFLSVTGRRLSEPDSHSSLQSSRALSDRRSLGGSSSLFQQPSVVAPVVLADVVEMDELSDEERSELQDLEAGDQSESSITGEAVKAATDDVPWIRKLKYEKGPPPRYPYLGVEKTDCHLLPENVPLCCLELNKACEHEEAHVGLSRSGHSGAVIVVSSQAHLGVYHFIIPLRAHYLPQVALKPIVILVEQRPDQVFLEAISCFPMVYYVIGSIQNIDDVLVAGILNADAMIVVSPYDADCNEDYMVDAKNIIAVQKLSRLFPDANVVTELSSRQNMKFAKFSRCSGKWNQRPSAAPQLNGELEFMTKMSVSRLSRDHMTYMFRPAFAAGTVFTASMLDTLLFQSYIKNWIVGLIYQLLGCHQVNGSGFLWQVRVDEELLGLGTYGRAFQRLAKKCGMLVFGVYRKVVLPQEMDEPDNSGVPKKCRRIGEMLRNRMDALGIDQELPEAKPLNDAYALVNPTADLPLQLGDLLYVLCSGKYDPLDDPYQGHQLSPVPEVKISEEEAVSQRRDTWGSSYLSKLLSKTGLKDTQTGTSV